MSPTVVRSASELRRDREGRRAVVMTMGALHDGHVALMTRARELVGADGTLIVTIFVNPTQFGLGEDFDRYPRTWDTDLAACAAAGVDVVFAPTVEEMYGASGGFTESSVTVDPGGIGELLEGRHRAGHFRGMLTVVAKLLSMTAPDLALFGEKDYQQLVLITRMVDDLRLPVTVVGVPTVREPDGLALSSRNRFLTPDERGAAACLSRALRTAAEAAVSGAEAAAAAGWEVLSAEPALEVDYLAVTDPMLGPAPTSGEGRILVAARLGATRLIDNTACRLGES